MQALPRITHGKDLCETHHQSLIGRNYASPNLHKTLIIYDWYTISRGGFMQNAKRVGTLPLVVIDYESHYNFHLHCSR